MLECTVGQESFSNCLMTLWALFRSTTSWSKLLFLNFGFKGFLTGGKY